MYKSSYNKDENWEKSSSNTWLFTSKSVSLSLSSLRGGGVPCSVWMEPESDSYSWWLKSADGSGKWSGNEKSGDLAFSLCCFLSAMFTCSMLSNGEGSPSWCPGFSLGLWSFMIVWNINDVKGSVKKSVEISTILPPLPKVQKAWSKMPKTA